MFCPRFIFVLISFVMFLLLLFDIPFMFTVFIQLFFFFFISKSVSSFFFFMKTKMASATPTVTEKVTKRS